MKSFHLSQLFLCPSPLSCIAFESSLYYLVERGLTMNKKKTLANFTDLLSDIATEVSQTCSTRNSVLNIYMGSSLPQLQLDLFKPILLENFAFLCSHLKDEELLNQIHMEMEGIALSLDLDPTVFQQARAQAYAEAKDATTLYTELCIFIIRHKANATRAEALEQWDHKKFSSNTRITLQLSAQRMSEAAEMV